MIDFIVRETISYGIRPKVQKFESFLAAEEFLHERYDIMYFKRDEDYPECGHAISSDGRVLSIEPERAEKECAVIAANKAIQPDVWPRDRRPFFSKACNLGIVFW